MTTLTIEKEPAVQSVECSDEALVVRLTDGRALVVPLRWFPRLAFGTPSERALYDLFADGAAIEWPELDEHIHVEDLLAGRRSEEGASSLKRWKKAMRRRRAERAAGSEPEPWGVGKYRQPYDVED